MKGFLARLVLAFLLGAFLSSVGSASPQLSQKLKVIRVKILGIQDQILKAGQSGQHAKENVKKIQALMKLQQEEKALGKERLGELENTVKELESRRGELRERITVQQKEIHKSLMALELSLREGWTQGKLDDHFENERLDEPRRKVLANLADRGVKEIETFRADLLDADQLEARIQDEKQQIAYVIQDLEEQEGILEFNRQLQTDLVQRKHQERLAQLESYRKLKSAEAQVEQLIGNFTARVELERANDRERQDTAAAGGVFNRGAFAHLKGRLPLPIASGQIISQFGRAFDPASKLYVFKKGIDISTVGTSTGKKSPVKAVFGGKIAYSGVLPDYGNVTIIDHGDHYYSLCAHLGDTTKKLGETVAAGDIIGQTDDIGTPVYFEIRSRNVAVNPLQWIVN